MVHIFSKKKIFWPLLIVTIVVNLLSWVFLLWKLPYKESSFLLHYNVYFGVDLYGAWWKLLVSPATGSLTMAINVLFIFLLRQILNFSSFIMMAVTLFIQFMIAFSVLLVVLLNL